jgi:hypothetical protein
MCQVTKFSFDINKTMQVKHYVNLNIHNILLNYKKNLLKFYLKKLGPFTNHIMKNYLICKRIKKKIPTIYSHLNLIKQIASIKHDLFNNNNFNF